MGQRQAEAQEQVQAGKKGRGSGARGQEKHVSKINQRGKGLLQAHRSRGGGRGRGRGRSPGRGTGTRSTTRGDGQDQYNVAPTPSAFLSAEQPYSSSRRARHVGVPADAWLAPRDRSTPHPNTEVRRRPRRALHVVLSARRAKVLRRRRAEKHVRIHVACTCRGAGTLHGTL